MNIPKCNNIIFDLDGVIVDTDKGRYLLLQDIIHQYGFDIKKHATVKDLEGISTLKFLKTKFPDISKCYENIISMRHEIFLQNLNKYCIPFPNVKEVIEEISKYYILHIATTNSTEIAKKILDFIQIEKYFNNIYGREITENRSNMKDYSNVLKKLNITSKDCIIIEDSKIGVLAAKKENVFCIAFNHYSNPIINNESDIVITNFMELNKLLK